MKDLCRKFLNLLSKFEKPGDLLLFLQILRSFIFFSPEAIMKRSHNRPSGLQKKQNEHYMQKVFLFTDFFFRRNVLWFTYTAMKRALILYHHLISTGHSISIYAGARKEKESITIYWWLLIDTAVLGHELDGKPPSLAGLLNPRDYLALLQFPPPDEAPAGFKEVTLNTLRENGVPHFQEIAPAFPEWIREEKCFLIHAGEEAQRTGKKGSEKEPLLPGLQILSLRDCCGDGWHYPDHHLGAEWVWSGERALLTLPEEHRALTLTVSHSLSLFTGKPARLSISDREGTFITEETVDHQKKIIDIPPGTKALQLSVSFTTKPSCVIPGSTDERLLGICLHSVSERFIYDEECHVLPGSIELETTQLCNIEPPCVMCPRIIRDRDRALKAPQALLDRLLPYVKKARSLSLHGIGEPLTDSRVFSLLESIDESTWTTFSTNGLLLDESAVSRILELKLKHINFSLDAAKPETYNNIRGQDLLLVKSNIMRLSKAKEERDLPYPVITLSMVLMKENFKEARDFVDFAHEVGAQRVLFQLLNPIHGDYAIRRGDFVFDYRKQIMDPHRQELREELRGARKICGVRGILFTTYNQELYDCVSE
jgi:MoaA/NifB/PqqE/SkfB family radical SAM enzyme